ncbi:hypothetical protein MTR_1g054950 [Medicago truncatula]|uniref:Uncharacterized protein n=1 Tax=Medicago truncatula TaxID=3880 RepID=A0A072VJ32_MEDTR|nr:hypothetical protein MTR_1g054950 [Medicago truncatula]
MYIAAEDIEAGSRTKFQTDPTLPIYLKLCEGSNLHEIDIGPVNLRVLLPPSTCERSI